MRKIAAIILIVLLATITNGQNQLSIGFNSTMAGRSATLTFSRTINNKNEFGGGLRYNINKLAHVDDQNKSYYKRLYATKPLHYIGIVGYYHYQVFQKLKYIKPFLFYDLQATYSTTRNRMLLPYSYDINGDVLYKEYIEYFGPFTWVEQNLGIGFKVDIINNWYLYQKYGAGMSFILGYDKKRLDKYFDWFAWEFGALVNVGIGYRIEPKKNK